MSPTLQHKGSSELRDPSTQGQFRVETHNSSPYCVVRHFAWKNIGKGKGIKLHFSIFCPFGQATYGQPAVYDPLNC